MQCWRTWFSNFHFLGAPYSASHFFMSQLLSSVDRRLGAVIILDVKYLKPVIFTSNKGGICDCPRCLSVCLSVSKITQKCVHGFGWNFACRQMSGHGRTGQLLSPIRIIVRMPELENLKVEALSKSVKQTPHSEQATGHGMHCREILFTPRCSP